MESPNRNRTRKSSHRNSHPCDFCRYKRAACLLHHQPPCELCKRLDKDCTFVGEPNKRRRISDPRRLSDSSHVVVSHHQSQSPSDIGMRSPFTETNSPGNEANFGKDVADSTSPNSLHAENHLPDTFPRDVPPSPSSLDATPGYNAQAIGLSGESDPYLLHLYRFDEKNECTFQQLRIRNVGLNDGTPTQFMLQNNSLARKAQPEGLAGGESDLRSEVADMIPEGVGKRLINLFWRYVQPYFPILSREQVIQETDTKPSSLPVCLLAAIYGHALPFCVFDDKLCVDVDTLPSADRLFKLAWMAALSLFHTPSLAVVQTMLLMIQRRPTNKHVADTPFKWVMLADTVALAQCLGLNLDPTDWSIPSWEKRLRRRLAWAVIVQDQWLSLNFGRSSHIQECDWDVSSLRADDFESMPEVDGDAPAFNHFLQLASLTEIVSKIQRHMFSVKATRVLSKSLEATFEVARPLRMELAQWLQDRPDVADQPSTCVPHHGLDGNGSIKLAYITAKISVFKALLRPKNTEAPIEARMALRTGAMAVAREMYDFLVRLEAHHLEAFWHSYSRVNFAIASNFIVLLFALSPSPADADESLTLLTRWRGLLRIKSRSCDLLNLSLLRLDAMFVAGLGKLIELTPSASEAASNRNL
ncbi:fungal specific transcription factor domain-containing protein [Colletotrichum graminicola M1.001]|uniref:Fungal specific transcription factor domain-containing protein n=1 Tax=Colletotrichum graminicola (strain M1.001 / M2 / FGSC 10212) TaxID=645133 RepID=E3QW58_COLGM|nr:fungal specific transcription factor domain-containing protein [Colletotrichum graminicola M1.001]EFQ35092.1 fungal specific transcription factor domain-containing protein [Colletotrichum graminicola M1.001]